MTLLEDLHQQIADMPGPSNDGPVIGWDDVESLNHVCQQLAELKEHFELTEN